MPYDVDVVAEPTTSPSRGLAVLGIIGIKPLLLLPHLILLFFVTMIYGLVVWVGYWAVLFTGRLPEGIQGFIVGYQRWAVRVVLWDAGIVDQYPPFGIADDR